LALKLKRPLTIARPSAVMLRVGYYLYAGSARGPGGLKAALNEQYVQVTHIASVLGIARKK
jgi:hypothetical protein